MTFFDDLPVFIRIVLLISSGLVLLVGVSLVWRMAKALFARRDRN